VDTDQSGEPDALQVIYSGAAAPIPEPATMALFALAVGGLAPAIRRRLRGKMNGLRTAAMIAGVAVLAAVTSGGMAAAITVDNSATSGTIATGGANPAKHSIAYDNTTDFLVVISTYSTTNNDSEYPDNPPTTPTVTYDGTALTNVYSSANDHGGSYIHYLVDPTDDGATHTLEVDFGDALDDEATFSDAMGFGALSLLGVDTADPVADSDTWSTNSGSHTMTSDTPGAISDGDFLVVASDAYHYLQNPNWGLTTANLTQLFKVDAVNNNPDSIGEYGPIAAGDLSGGNGDELFVDNVGKTRVGTTGGAVFNSAAVIPEPATMAMLALAIGGLAPAVRRRLRAAA
jgi:hypothetical protein